jgi:hypothetical protein
MFFTNYSYTDEEKVEAAGKACLMERRKIIQMEQGRGSRPDEIECKKQPREQYHQHYY